MKKIIFTFIIVLVSLSGAHPASAITFYLGSNSDVLLSGNIDKSTYAPGDNISITGYIHSTSPIVDSVYLNATTNGKTVSIIPGGSDPNARQAAINGSIFQNTVNINTTSSAASLFAPNAIGSNYLVTFSGGVHLVPSFSLPLSCNIPLQSTSCTVGTGWSLMNVNYGAYLTQDGVNILTYTPSSPDAISLNVPYSSSLFALFDSTATQVGSSTVSAVCTSGTAWGGANNGGCLQRPTASLTASSTYVSSGTPVTLTWSSTDATSCSGYNFTVNSTTGTTYGSTTSGYATIYPASTNTYRVFCSNAGSSVQSSVSITVY